MLLLLLVLLAIFVCGLVCSVSLAVFCERAHIRSIRAQYTNVRFWKLSKQCVCHTAISAIHHCYYYEGEQTILYLGVVAYFIFAGPLRFILQISEAATRFSVCSAFDGWKPVQYLGTFPVYRKISYSPPIPPPPAPRTLYQLNPIRWLMYNIHYTLYEYTEASAPRFFFRRLCYSVSVVCLVYSVCCSIVAVVFSFSSFDCLYVMFYMLLVFHVYFAEC